MKWNLRLTAANRGIWKASELLRRLAERGMLLLPEPETVPQPQSAGGAQTAAVAEARPVTPRRDGFVILGALY